jgi:peroxiredoxin
MEMPILQPCTQAPDFSVASHMDKPFALNSFKGRKTVVAFMPFAFTGG